MHRWVYAIDASIKLFIRDINSFRLLIINAAIPITILTTYELLMNILNTYVDSLTTTVAPYSKSIINNAVYFINSITYLVVAALVIIFFVTSAFMVNGIVRNLRDDFRAMISIFRSGVGVIMHIALIMLLISLYSFTLGISISAALVLVLMKILTTLGIIPITNYGVDITGVLPVMLPLACVICVTYIIEGIIWVRRYAYLP
ncbi:hypothetical protein [Vulcanisaeta distributa]|uniref:Uncharacterized protein n=1 Tax=Vulcanisaeta distributa (strain DSM 14429 / JCM 11212 / NBRC 100878 / IC-017) TaxID=572478 RepID=E1QU34_VULDI|nr:hypothetical protein [Vulcanisaeta distributa]ADN49831.1 hypothetical protein Vdis_0430 [Vulcanisaeta distributa DSM 14429]